MNRLAALCSVGLLAACGATSSTTDGGSVLDNSDASVKLPDGGVSDCTTPVCAANVLLSVLTTEQRSAVGLAQTDSAARTKWSNLPGVTRAGVKMGALDANSQAAALSMMSTVLTTAGMSDLKGVLAADDYLGSKSSGGGMGGQYSSTNYSVAVFGTPSSTANWSIAFGGHHMAYNINYVAGVGYPTPHHMGVEPKAAFTINGTTYQPLTGEGDAFFAVFKSLTATDLDAAYLSGQTFADVLIGPLEYGTGSSALAKAKYPTTRTGVLVSSLTADQKTLVTAAISEWVSDYNADIAAQLMADYTSEAAFGDTYLSWGGTKSSGVDPDVNGTYLRIDGPRLWLELSCQAGVVISGISHFHTIYRDKTYDYGGEL